jgi:hypothetical protein
VLGLALAIGGFALAFSAGRGGLAAGHYSRAQAYVFQVRDSRAPVEAAAWARARDEAQAALEIGGRGAQALELAAQIALYGLRLDENSPAARMQLAQEGVADLREALAQRPSWPYAWAALAVAKLSADEIDAEMAAAVRNAMRFGPQEERIYRELAQLWIAGVDLKLGDLAVPLDLALTRALPDHPQAWVDRADRAGRGKELCARSALPKGARSRCEQLGWR